MCGICGIIGNPDPSELGAMGARLRRRGPDGEGSFLEGGAGLHHNRLAVIDPEGGAQPMWSCDGRKVMVANCEIYNYNALIHRLVEAGCSFESRCDAEVIIHLYEHFGADLVQHLRGFYAFALWDLDAQVLLLGRDPLGIKPLFTWTNRDRFCFASEMKALLALDDVETLLNERSLREKLAFEYLPAGKTLLKDIRQLPAGHTQQVAIDPEGQLQVKSPQRFYTLPTARRADFDLSASVDGLLGTLRSAVEARLMSDVPLGLILSGGLDSSLLAALHSEISNEGLIAYTITEEEPNRDLRHAVDVASALGMDHEIVTLDRDWIWSHLAEFVWINENIDYTVIFFMRLFEAMRERLTVGLCGQGADELFGGYDRYRDPTAWSSTIRNRLSQMGLDPIQYPGTESMTDLPRMIDYEITAGQLDNFQLRLVDRNSMAAGVEVRVPFLDLDVVELSQKVPHDYKIRGDVEKYILKEVARRTSLQHDVIDRVKFPAGRGTSPHAIQQLEQRLGKFVRQADPIAQLATGWEPVMPVMVDLFSHIFIEHGGELPRGFAPNDLY